MICGLLCGVCCLWVYFVRVPICGLFVLRLCFDGWAALDAWWVFAFR